MKAMDYRKIMPIEPRFSPRSTDPKASATSVQGIRGYLSLIAALKFTFFKLKEKKFVKRVKFL